MKNLQSSSYASSSMRTQDGFTLIELLVVIGIVAVLAATVLIAINPARQFAQARNTQRTSDANAILNAIGQSLADGRGSPCAVIPSVAAEIAKPANSGQVDLSCLVPTYISKMPTDPQSGSWTSDTNFESSYTVVKDATTGRITVSAPDTEPPATSPIAITR